MEIACLLLGAADPSTAGERGTSTSKDSLEAAESTEWVVRQLEEIGAAVESERAGEAFFAIDGLRGIHGGDSAGVVAAARRAAAMPVRIGVAPTRFAAFVAASGKQGPISSLPVATLIGRLDLPADKTVDLAETLARLGVGTLGALAALPRDRVADRFGPAGLCALQLARGEDEPLRPRHPYEELVEEIELPEGVAGERLERTLELLVDRLLAAPQRRGRTLLGLRLGASLSDGGSWSVDQGLGRPTASPRALRTVLAPRLESLPAPAASLRLRAIGLGPRAADQLELAVRGDESRRRRLGAALREVRAAQGSDSLLKVLSVDGASRIPERRSALTPFPVPGR
jgi:protein ImuB